MYRKVNRHIHLSPSEVELGAQRFIFGAPSFAPGGETYAPTDFFVGNLIRNRGWKLIDYNR